MDAETTWHVWRRILTDDRLSQQVLAGQVRVEEFGLDPAQATVAAAYGAHPEGTRWAVETYRYRSVSSALHALSAGAPMTLRLLQNAGLDLRQLAEAFAAGRGWADDGPFVYRACAAFLDSLLASENCYSVTGLQDVTALELAVMRLMIQCARLPGTSWPAAGERGLLPADPAAGWYVQSGLGVLTTTAHRLTAWLTDAARFGRAPLAEEPENLLVYLPDLEHRYALCILGDDVAAVFRQLAVPSSHASLARDLQAPAPALAEALANLTELGVVQAVATCAEAAEIARLREPG